MIIRNSIQKVLTARGEQPISGKRESLVEYRNSVALQRSRAHELMGEVCTQRMERLLKRMQHAGQKKQED